MKSEDIMIYEQLRDTLFSYNCEQQAVRMLCACEIYLLSDFSLKHSLLRLIIRPLFYMDCMTTEFVIEFIKANQNNFKHPLMLCNYMKENADMISVIIDELMLCCDFYDTVYDAEKNAVTHDNQIFYHSSDFKNCFFAYFRNYNIPEEEINRIFTEENYEDDFKKIKS